MFQNLKYKWKKNRKEAARFKRKMTVRKKISGDVERPRLTVFRSARHIYAQLIDDRAGVTLAAASTLEGPLKAEISSLKKKEQAVKVGTLLAERAQEKGITTVVFDRNGFRFHGRVAAVAKGAREAGLKF